MGRQRCARIIREAFQKLKPNRSAPEDPLKVSIKRPGMLFHAATTLSLTCHLLATVDYADRAVPLRQFLDRAAMLNAISREMSKYLAGLSFTSRFDR